MKRREQKKNKIKIVLDETNSTKDAYAYWLTHLKPCKERTHSSTYDIFLLLHSSIDIEKKFHEVPPLVDNGERMEVLEGGESLSRRHFGRVHPTVETRTSQYLRLRILQESVTVSNDPQKHRDPKLLSHTAFRSSVVLISLGTYKRPILFKKISWERFWENCGCQNVKMQQNEHCF